MSGNIQKLFANYAELRSRGIEPKAVLDKLREPITRLSQDERRELARYVNALETGKIASPRQKLPPPQPNLASRPIKRIEGEHRRDVTSTLMETSEIFFSYEFFGSDSTLVLQVRGQSSTDQSHHYQIQPQLSPQGLVLGRAGENKMPDVDFQPHGADVRGVSRQHLLLRYDDRMHNLTVTDLNSSNGSFINGQRLYHNESHVLRNGDELRLGRMILDVVFQHFAPQEEQPTEPVQVEQPTEPAQPVQDNDLPEWLR